MRRGQIWLVNLGVSDGTSKQSGVRPVVIISNNAANTHSPVVHVIPITSKLKNKLPTHVKLEAENGLQVESIAMAEQSMLVSKEQFIRLVGEVDSETLNKIASALLIQFGIWDQIEQLVKNREVIKR